MAEDQNEPAAVGLKECRHGRMLYLLNDSYIGRSLDYYGEYGEFEGQVFAQMIRPGQSVVEVGANIGAHTVHLAKLVGPGGTVLAFEPQRSLFYLLCANLALNEHFHVRAVHAAVGATAGSIPVPLLDHRAKMNFGALSLPLFTSGDQVPLMVLDDFDLPSLRLLKVDVEGMETDVLRGARRTIAQHRPLLYVENDRRDQSEQLIRLIMELGYDLHWHLPFLFNADNFRGRSDDIFPKVASINMLCIPQETTANLTGFRRITGPGDWWRDQ
ncbi:MAG TPA: FkbM family methyltransferase [Stellaceae bacterium]|jgi:FkbM family methyltransferase|nr:FkbM family methyltransferase [Stellaceae bacterium]